ncbi:hypothetical protein GCM10027066_19520 [Dyella jejuensis]
MNGGYINEAQTNGGIWFQTPDGVYEGLTQGLSAEQGRAVEREPAVPAVELGKRCLRVQLVE